MTKEEYIKTLILQSGNSVKAFAKSVGLPYTTLIGMLSNGLGGASLSNIEKMCNGLSITVDELLRIDKSDDDSPVPFVITEQEKLLVTRYREKTEMRIAIDTLLGLSE